MKSTFYAQVYEFEGSATQRPYFEAEVEGVYLNTNIEVLKHEPIVFVHDTRRGLIQDIIAYLKSKGFSGNLRII